MARIRSIKPEFWTSGQVLECSTNARLLFVGMWNFADDDGRLPHSARSIKAQVFPADPFSIEDVERMIDELSTNDLVLPYEVDGKRYLQITGWAKHQRIDHKQPARYPPPQEHSTNARRTFAPDKIGKEGVDKKGEKDAAPNGAHSAELVLGLAEPAKPYRSDPEKELFQRGKEILGKDAGGLIARLLKAKDNKPELARAAIETAATKQSPREYIGAVLRGADSETRKVVQP